jgi:CheY-like chemotaxis protein
MAIRVLVVEPDVDATLFLQDVLTELDGGPYWTHWTHLETVFASNWEEAEALLRPDTGDRCIDVALVELNLPGSPPTETFRRFQQIAADVPMVVLADPAELASAQRLLRDGAQDVLDKSQIDCGPLAQSIRFAIERHRLLRATRALAAADAVTGVMTANAFLSAVGRDRELARHQGGRMLLVFAEPCEGTVGPPNEGTEGAGSGYWSRDLTLLQLVETLRAMSSPLDLLGRLSESRLSLAVVETSGHPLQERWEELQKQGRTHGVLLGAAIFDAKHPVSLEGLLRLAEADLQPRRQAARAAGRDTAEISA